MSLLVSVATTGARAVSFRRSRSQDNDMRSPIEHIFVSEKVRVIRHGVITQHNEGRLPSDHYPVLADLELVGCEIRQGSPESGRIRIPVNHVDDLPKHNWLTK